MSVRRLAVVLWPRYSATLDRMNRAAGFERWTASHRAPGFRLRRELYAHVAPKVPIDYLEFGVWTGASLRDWMAVAHSQSRFYGFDTFTGLPEAWDDKPRGAFATDPPQFADPRVQLVRGLFQHTLQGFLATFRRQGKLVIHLDADLYSSTLFVLASVSPHLQPGDLLLFDEFSDLLHEWRAYEDWSRAFLVETRVIGQANNFRQVAMEVQPSAPSASSLAVP